MSVGAKIVVGLAVACAVLAASATAVVGGAIVTGGLARVSLHTAEGPDLELAVPGALISAAAAAGSRLAAAHGHHGGLLAELEHGGHLPLDAEIGDTLRQLLSVLEDVPDATLVEVADGADLVRIVKRGRHLVVRVIDGADELSLEVTVPIRTARRTAALVLG